VFYVDDVIQEQISGSMDWQQLIYDIPSGSHILGWGYMKDGSDSSGSDCGWVDKIVWVPSGGSTPSSFLSEALDTTLDFTTGGSSDWFYQVETTYYDLDAAQSGEILDEQESWIQTTVDGPGTLSFYWKVSSETNYDFLQFHIDGVLQDRISGSVNWQQMIYTLATGSHSLEWRYVKDLNTSADSDRGWVDKVEWVTGAGPTPISDTLPEALDTTLDFIMRGDLGWFYQTSTSYYDGDAAQSGQISDEQESGMEAMVYGPGALSFHWKVSSEANFDFLEFYVDGILQDQISGSVDWHRLIYSFPSGQHTLEWRYVKDYGVGSGSDCGWVDKVDWVTGVGPTPTSDPLSVAMDTTLDFTTGGSSDWFYQTNTSYDEDAAQSGDISDDQESWMETTVDGPGALGFYWKVSSEDNYDFLEFCIDGVMQDRISGLSMWVWMVYTIPSGSHTLEWRYVTDYSVSSGSDSGWVDKVDWVPGGETPPSPPPTPSYSLSGALDTILDVVTSGSLDWFYQTTTFFNDGDAAQSGDILDEQESRMQTMVNGPGSLSFYWKVSSEDRYDFLVFYIDDVMQDRISGSVDWHEIAYDIPSGSHTLEWRYIKDNFTSSGDDSGWVDKLEWVSDAPPPYSDPLAEALDTTVDFTTGGSSDCHYQTTTSYYGGDAAQSGDISDDQESWMETTVDGPGVLSFYWKVSSEEDYDFLVFYVDDVVQEQISGSVDWHQMTYNLSSGSHILGWGYIKDSSNSSDSDCGWVDRLEGVSGGEPGPQPQPGDEFPIAHWKMDDNADDTTVLDSSDGDNHGTAQQNTSTLSVAGMIDSALAFNGISDYISVPDNPEWTFIGDFTITIWVKFNTFNSKWWESAFIGHDEGPGHTNKWIFSYDTGDSKTLFHINYPGANGPIIKGNQWAAQAGAWYFIAVTRSGSTYTFYREGISDGAQSDGTAIPDVAAPLTIGWAEEYATFDGALDDVRIYNRALSAAEITALYDEGAGP